MTSSLIDAMRKYREAVDTTNNTTDALRTSARTNLLEQVLGLTDAELLQLAHDRQRLDWLEHELKRSNSAFTLKALGNVGNGIEFRCTHDSYSGERKGSLRESIDTAYADLNRPTWSPS